jgi:outer membrane autotransporter protein
LVAGGANATTAAEQLQGSPAALSAAGSAAVSATGTQVIAVGSSRLASLRTGSQYASTLGSGFAGGSDANKFGVWMKPFVNFGDQNQRKGIAGYETDTYGMALGGDVKVGRTTIGASFSYADTDIDSKGVDRARTDVSSYQGTFYADYTTDKWYVEGLFGYARNEIGTKRDITFSATSASADYGSNQYMFSIGGGMPIEVAKNHFFTPNASFQYTLVENETYTETGAGVLNLRVDQDEVNVAMGKFGVRYHTHNEMNGGGTVTPEIRTALLYDFAGDDGQSTSTFNGGGAAFGVTGADVVELGYTVGLGLSYAPLDSQGLTLSANYDMNQKTDFIGHSGNFALRYEF